MKFLLQESVWGRWETIKKYNKRDFKVAKKHCLNRGMQRKKTQPSYRTRIAIETPHNGVVRVFPDNPEFLKLDFSKEILEYMA